MRLGYNIYFTIKDNDDLMDDWMDHDGGHLILPSLFPPRISPSNSSSFFLPKKVRNYERDTGE